MPNQMTTAMENELRSKIIGIVQEYLGPTAERFVDRQITFHLNKRPDEINKKDISVLINWITISINILNEDKGQTGNIAQRIESLAK